MTIFEELEEYYTQHLNRKEIRQFHKAAERDSSRLLTQIIQPNAYRPDRGTYMGVESRLNVLGHSHLTARDLVAAKADWEHQSFFTNTLRIAHHGDCDFHRPMNRTALGPYQIHTFEFDSRNLAFFQHQLSWFRSHKNPRDAPIGKFLAGLRDQYADCVGLNVTYSGNKSFHFHFVFSTALLTGRVPEPTSLRNGLVSSWERLRQDFMTSPHLSIPQAEAPDATLRFPDAYRRLPGGFRLTEASHFFGLPKDTPAPQLCMFEHLALDRQGSGASSVFEVADFLKPLPTTGRTGNTSSKRSPKTNAPTALCAAEDQYCAAQMAAIFDGLSEWPRFEEFRSEKGTPRAYFANSPTDRNPSSYMDETFRTVLLQGANPLDLTNDRDGTGTLMPRLPQPLGEMIAIWTREYQERNLAPGGRTRSPVEQTFVDQAVDQATATRLVGETLNNLITQDICTAGAHMLGGPEGIRKTRSLFMNSPSFYALLQDNDLPGLIMFAFQTYKAAEDKAAEFNQAHDGIDHNGRSFRAVVHPSWSHLYERACATLGLKMIRLTDAHKSGFSTLHAAISARQPDVIAWFQAFFMKQRAEWTGRVPVIFTVHDVAHGWGKSNPTRLMFSKWWWSGLAQEERQAKAREETELGLLIHDEVSAENLLTVVRQEMIDWVHGLAAERDPKDAKRKLWPSNAPIVQKLATFNRYAASNPPPSGLTFEKAREIRSIKKAQWDFVVTRYSAEYGHRPPAEGHQDIYAATAGNGWGIYVKPWPSTSAHKTIVVTTEAVPTVIARMSRSNIQVTELDTALIDRDAVSVVASREVTSANAADLVQQEREAHKEDCGRTLFGIGNKMAHIADTETHIGAKGSNAYIGKDIVQTMVPMPPEQYEFYEALNAWTKRDDMVRLKHMDDFNQTAGRNLGFRKPASGPAPTHKLLINRRLFESLAPVMGHARYEMRETVSQHTQKKARAAARKPDAFVVPQSSSSKDVLAAIRAALREQKSRNEDVGEQAFAPMTIQ